MRPPDYLASEEVSFLVHFYLRLYNLPGGMEPNGQLRRCLAHLISDYPDSMSNPMASLRMCMDEHRRLSRLDQYEGDLEADFLRSLGEIQRSAKAMPFHVEIDFGR